MTRGVGLFKRLEDISPEDILWVKVNHIAERQDLEFKGEDYKPEDRIERLRDIASMANGGGAFLIMGIKSENSQASEIVNIENPQKAVDSLMNSCLSCIQPRLVGLDQKIFQVEDKNVIIFFVPPSGDSLFAVTYDDKVEFWRRYNDDKRRMTSEEIRQAFQNATGRYEKSMVFLSKSIEKFINEPSTRVLGTPPLPPMMLLATVPYGADHELIDPFQASIKESLLNSPLVKSKKRLIPLLEVEPTLQGARIQNPDTECSIVVYRNGYIAVEISLPLVPEPDTKRIDGGYMVLLLKHALCSLGDIYRKGGITTPILADVGFKGLKGYSLLFQYPGRPMPDLSRYSVESTEQHFNIEPIEIPPGMPLESIGGKIAIRIWRAFHQEECPFVGENGEIQVPEE